MKALTLLLILGTCTTVFGAGASEIADRAKKIAGVQSTVAANGYWCRAANGSWVWMSPSVEATKTSNADSQSAAPRGTRVYSYYRPNVVTSYPNDFRPEVINGINWYLNGRSYFSD